MSVAAPSSLDLEQLRAALPNYTKPAVGPIRTVTIQLDVSDEQAEFIKQLAIIHHQFMSALRQGDVDQVSRLMCVNSRSLIVVFLNQAQQSDLLPEHYHEIIAIIANWQTVAQAKEIIFNWMESNYANSRAYKVIQACCEHLFSQDKDYFPRLENLLIKIAYLTGDEDPFASGFGELYAILQTGDVQKAVAHADAKKMTKHQLQKCVILGIGWALERKEQTHFFGACLRFMQGWIEQPLEFAPCHESLVKTYTQHGTHLSVIWLASPSFATVLEQRRVDANDKLIGAIIRFLYTGELDVPLEELPKLARLAHIYSLGMLTRKIQQLLDKSQTIETLSEICTALGTDDLSWCEAMHKAVLKTLPMCSKDNVQVLASKFARYLKSLDLDCCTHVEEELLVHSALHLTHVRDVVLSSKSTPQSIARVGNLKNCLSITFPDSLPDSSEINLPDLYYVTSLRELILNSRRYVNRCLDGVHGNRFFFETLTGLQKLVLHPEGPLDPTKKLSVIAKCPKLQHLELYCLSTENLIDLFQHDLSQLRILKLAFASKLVKEPREISEALFQKQLLQLEGLALEGPFTIDIVDVACLPQLQSLSLVMNGPELDGLELITTLRQAIQRCIYLESLDLVFKSDHEPSFAQIKSLFEMKKLSTLWLNGQRYTRKMVEGYF